VAGEPLGDLPPPEIKGDASLIAADLSWHPSIPFEVTLNDVFDDAVSRRGPAPA
jgi:hypothetical protein